MHRFIVHRKTSRYNLSTIWTFWQIYIRLMLFRTSQLCTTYKDVVIFSCLLFVSWNIRLPNGSRLVFLSFLSIKYNIYTNRKWLMFSQTENSFRRNCSDTRACNNQSVFRVIHIGVWDNIQRSNTVLCLLHYGITNSYAHCTAVFCIKLWLMGKSTNASGSKLQMTDSWIFPSLSSVLLPSGNEVAVR